MIISAKTVAERRRRDRRMDVQRAACRLVIERGYDGFTMDDLAEAVGVSRRTLFNLVQDKASSVLGQPEIEDHVLVKDFRAAPATEHPLEELLDLAIALVDDVDQNEDNQAKAIECHRLMEQSVAADPKVAALISERFGEFAQFAAVAVAERQGWPEDDLRATLLGRALLMIVQVGLDEFDRRDDDTTLADVFREIAALVRAGGLR